MSYPLNPVIVPHFLSRHSLSLFTLSPHTNFSTISLTQLSHPFLSLSLILLSSSTPSLSLLSHPSFLPRFRNTLSSLSITLLITPLSFHSSFSSLFLTSLYFSLHSFTPLSLSFTKKSNPLYHPSLAPRSPSVTQHTLIPLSSLSLCLPLLTLFFHPTLTLSPTRILLTFLFSSYFLTLTPLYCISSYHPSPFPHFLTLLSHPFLSHLTLISLSFPSPLYHFLTQLSHPFLSFTSLT